MGRRIIYKIGNTGESMPTDSQWREVSKLQHWYNSEFIWSTGRISFKRYVVFPNTEEFSDLDQSIWEIIGRRQVSLRKEGLSEEEIVAQLEKDRLIFVKWGGYFDNCFASGFTRVADNEWNAFLVCDFLLKASTLCPDTTIQVFDEGQFVKTGAVWFRDGAALVPKNIIRISSFIDEMLEDKHVFSIVDPEKYNKHPAFKNSIPDFNRLDRPEQRTLLQNWNWLGYGDSYDVEGDDSKGFDLNRKVRKFQLVG